MTIRNELEAMLEEFEDFAYDGAPLGVALDKVREILAKTEPTVLTTGEDLNSDEASKTLGPVTVDGGGFAVVPKPPAPSDPAPERTPLPALVTPCHGMPLWVSTRTEGRWVSTDVVDEISCDAPGCRNTWNPNGTVAYETPVV